jgi:ABC-type transport system involved in cytochrome c biogenesis permease subunit
MVLLDLNVDRAFNEFLKEFCEGVPIEAHDECITNVRDQYKDFLKHTMVPGFRDTPEQSKYAFILGGLSFLIFLVLWILTFFFYIESYHHLIGYRWILFIFAFISLIIAIIGLYNLERIRKYLRHEHDLLKARKSSK